MKKHREITIQRLDRFTSSQQFHDVNLASMLVTKSSKVSSISYFQTKDRLPFAVAKEQTFKKTDPENLTMGPSWHTYWFHLNFSIPLDFKDEKVVLLFDPSCEALFYNKDGMPLQGITGGNGGDRNVDVLLARKAVGGETFEFYVEVALNGMFGNPGEEAGIITAPLENRQFTFGKLELQAINQVAQDLWWDFEILKGIVKDMPKDSQIAADALYIANKIVNIVKYDQPSSLDEARKVSIEFFKTRSEFGYADHVITATGHCHIDTAWLWPYDETKRKCARSWATQCDLMDRYPEYKFSCSQAQQFEWLHEGYPLLFERIKEKVKSGNFIPVGGTWVEMDCNVPSGEAFCRQFLYGQKYFEKTFGERHSVFWLPDTFGYSAQLPQIIKQSGLKYFFTQKLSWNNINKYPNTTFNWVGLDGTSVLTHFSPADTYCAQVTPREVSMSVTNNKDREYSDRSLMLFGNGDGGGGALAAMIERGKRLKSVAGMPAKLEFGNPNEFYECLDERSRDLVEWKGELYFELHRGTYTTQAKVKKYNRQLEYALREVEILGVYCSLNGVIDGFEYPKTELDRLWKLVLLNQFHDVLPGSSIEMVYTDAHKFYLDVESSAKNLIEKSLSHLTKSSSTEGASILNLTSWGLQKDVYEMDMALLWGCPVGTVHTLGNGKGLVVVDEVKPMSSLKVASGALLTADFYPVVIVEVLSSPNLKDVKEHVAYQIENQFIKVHITSHGQIQSLIDKRLPKPRQLIPTTQPSNVFKIYEDIPLYWDAWDVEVYHLEKGWDCSLGSIQIKEQSPLRVVLSLTAQITPTSILTQDIVFTATSAEIEFRTRVDWNENRRILKVEFPVLVDCDYATYESQFGYVQRPTHSNTSWDMARFEVCGHKFVDFSEFGYGVAIFNDCKYGHAVQGNKIRMSLLRSPKAPDAHCDIGVHEFRYSIYPHLGTFHESDVIQRAYQFNVKPRIVNGNVEMNESLFKSSESNLVLDTIKQSEDKSKILIRLYEGKGGRGVCLISSFLKIKKVWSCNILEDFDDKASLEVKIDEILGSSFEVEFMPFQILSFLVEV